MKAPKDAVNNVPHRSTFYTTLDVAHDYWQVSLEHKSQHLMTFITPWGRYNFVRAPVGLSSTSDEYSSHRDKTLQGMTNLQKVVDNVLMYGEIYKDHCRDVRNFITWGAGKTE